MADSTNRILDELSKLMTDAAGLAQGVKREAESMFRSGAERLLRDMDVVTREEFEAVKEMAAKAREVSESLKAQVEDILKRLPPKA